MSEEKLSHLQRIRKAAEKFFVAQKENDPSLALPEHPDHPDLPDLPDPQAPSACPPQKPPPATPERSDGGRGKPSVGQLALDVHETPEHVIVTAPIAGVKPEDINVVITENLVTIKGERKQDAEISPDAYIAQECYWGEFARDYQLPVAVVGEEAAASLKDGVLRVTIPKLEAKKKKVVKVRAA